MLFAYVYFCFIWYLCFFIFAFVYLCVCLLNGSKRYVIMCFSVLVFNFELFKISIKQVFNLLSLKCLKHLKLKYLQFKNCQFLNSVKPF